MSARDCKHGRLARSCSECDMEQEINFLRAENAAQALLIASLKEDLGLASVALEQKQVLIASADAILSDTQRQNAEQAEQIAELQNTLSHRDYWYGCRSARLFDWAHEKLPDDLRHEYFSIVANGTIGLEEPPTYAQQFNRMKYRAEEADKTVADLVEYAKGLRKALLHITSNTTPEGAGQRLLWIEAESALAKPMPKVMKEDS
jgi:DNA-directed RNA polymerase subunit F